MQLIVKWKLSDTDLHRGWHPGHSWHWNPPRNVLALTLRMNSGSYVTTRTAIISNCCLVLSFGSLNFGWQMREPLTALIRASCKTNIRSSPSSTAQVVKYLKHMERIFAKQLSPHLQWVTMWIFERAYV